MTKEFPRAPQLVTGTCIATAALIDSAQRVFNFRSASAIHWIDLCTLIEAVVLHEKIAVPVLHAEYSKEFTEPLMQANLIDPWWPEAGIINSMGQTKEQFWRDHSNENAIAQAAVALMSGGWPDEHFDSLSDIRKRAVNGIAHGFSEAALTDNDDQLQILIWGIEARRTPGTRFETAAASCLTNGIDRLTKMSPADRAAFNRPHTCTQDVYNDYAEDLRNLANDAECALVKSVIEEPYFDTVSVESAARDTLHAMLKESYEQNVIKQISGKYAKVVPASPLAAIAFSKSSSLAEVFKVAVDLRDQFKAYRELLATYRKLQAEVVKTQTLAASKELDNVERAFLEALQYSMTRTNTDLEIGPKYVFDLLHGIKNVAVWISTDYKALVKEASSTIFDLMKGSYYSNYGGVFEIVNQFPKLAQLGATSRRLTGQELDGDIAKVVTNAATVIKRNYGLTGIGREAPKE
jgi:hypothetical protein